MLSITWVQGDTEPLTFVITDRTGTALDLSAATGTLRVRKGSTVVINHAAVAIIDGAAGQCEYLWSEADAGIPPGVYEGRIRFTRSGKTISTLKFALTIEEE
jgi:hypothetical protein